MCHFSAFETPVAYIVTRFQTAPSHKACRRSEHLHINTCFRNDCRGCAFLDTGDGLQAFVWFGVMFFAEPDEFLLTVRRLFFDQVECFLQLSENNQVGF